MIFDDQKIPYTLIMDEDVRKGGLRERFDVILYPDTGRSLKDIVTGIDPQLRPARLHEDAAVPDPRHADLDRRTSPAASPGPGSRTSRTSCARGGVLVTLGGASTLPLDGGHRARRPARERPKDLVNPGSELRVRFRRPDHPLAYGYPETTSVFREGEPLYDVRRGGRGPRRPAVGHEDPEGRRRTSRAEDETRPRRRRSRRSW